MRSSLLVTLCIAIAYASPVASQEPNELPPPSRSRLTSAVTAPESHSSSELSPQLRKLLSRMEEQQALIQTARKQSNSIAKSIKSLGYQVKTVKGKVQVYKLVRVN